MPEIEELTALEISLYTSIDGTTQTTITSIEELIGKMRLQGMDDDSIRRFLVNDLKSGGRIFGTYTNALGRFTTNAVEEAGGIASRGVFERAGITNFQWQTAGGNVCPDCISRSGDTRTMEQWRMVGIPKSGFSVCGFNCNCVLVPSGKGRSVRNRAARKKELKEKFGRI
ncbi:TPA: hypothetical protein DE059_03595 [Candidatus Peribacteria bacterium]|nr:hypothetical protein [Candidatus Peribacteria bacterium]